MALTERYKAEQFVIQMIYTKASDYNKASIRYIILRINRDKTLHIHYTGTLPYSDQEYILARFKKNDIEAIVWYFKSRFNLRHSSIHIVVDPNITLETKFENNAKLLSFVAEEEA